MTSVDVGLERGVFASARLLLALVVGLSLAACGGGDGSVDSVNTAAEVDSSTASEVGWVGDVYLAVAAVEEELGEGQEYFEVTATAQVTNVFVAVDGATAVIPYAYVDGELLEPAPRLDGASGQTFLAGAIRFDESLVLTGVEGELPNATIDALSVEGGPNGAVRYVVSARSEQGGVLDVEVGTGGQVLAVQTL